VFTPASPSHAALKIGEEIDGNEPSKLGDGVLDVYGVEGPPVEG